MNLLSILAHPRNDSFCRAAFDLANSTLVDFGHDLVVHDLYQESFDPVLKAEESYTTGDSAEVLLQKSDDPIILAHRQDIVQADGLLIVHPNWWGKPPAILSGWLDRVLVPGVAYRLETGEGEPTGLLRLQHAVVINTTDTPPERERNVLGDPLNLIWANCVLPYCGTPKVDRRVFGPIAGSSVEARSKWIKQIKEAIIGNFGRA